MCRSDLTEHVTFVCDRPVRQTSGGPWGAGGAVHPGRSKWSAAWGLDDVDHITETFIGTKYGKWMLL